MIEKTKHECLRCGYKWESKNPNPKSCVFCKSYKWNIPKPEDKKEK